jgi:hypothetical protein
VLELLGFDYDVTAPRKPRESNKSPRVVYVKVSKVAGNLCVYNTVTGNTWAAGPDGKPIASIKSIEDLHAHLLRTYRPRRARD